MDYSKGNMSVFQEFSFEEILEVLEYQAEQQENEMLLKVYQATYAALGGISFEEFKNEAYEAVNKPDDKRTAKEIETRVEELTKNVKWEVR